jgi:hypothetical protein
VVFGLTISHQPADFGYALSLLAGLVVPFKIPFFKLCIGRADIATNAQTSPMLDVSQNRLILCVSFRGLFAFIISTVLLD